MISWAVVITFAEILDWNQGSEGEKDWKFRKKNIFFWWIFEFIFIAKCAKPKNCSVILFSNVSSMFSWAVSITSAEILDWNQGSEDEKIWKSNKKIKKTVMWRIGVSLSVMHSRKDTPRFNQVTILCLEGVSFEATLYLLTFNSLAAWGPAKSSPITCQKITTELHHRRSNLAQRWQRCQRPTLGAQRWKRSG